MVYINSQSFPAEYLKTPEEITNGMMGRKTLEGCMVFKLGKGHHSFWMKNCLIPLDIVFVNNKKITKIYENCQPCDICNEHYKGYGDIVLEFEHKKNKNFKINDKIVFIK